MTRRWAPSKCLQQKVAGWRVGFSLAQRTSLFSTGPSRLIGLPTPYFYFCWVGISPSSPRHLGHVEEDGPSKNPRCNRVWCRQAPDKVVGGPQEVPAATDGVLERRSSYICSECESIRMAWPTERTLNPDALLLAVHDERPVLGFTAS